MRRTRSPRGFTLIELMVVIVILGMLVAIVGPNVWDAIFRTRVGTAQTQMKVMSDAVMMYYMNHKKLPGSLEELAQPDPKSGEPLMKSIPVDPWGTPYEYKRLTGKDFTITSFGEDLQQGTEDDVVWPDKGAN